MDIRPSNLPSPSVKETEKQKEYRKDLTEALNKANRTSEAARQAMPNGGIDQSSSIKNRSVKKSLGHRLIRFFSSVFSKVPEGDRGFKDKMNEAMKNFRQEVEPIDLAQNKQADGPKKASWETYQKDNLVIDNSLEKMRENIKKNDALLIKEPELQSLMEKKASWENDVKMVEIAYPQLLPLFEKIEKDTAVIENKLIKESEERVSLIKAQKEKIQFFNQRVPTSTSTPGFTRFVEGFCHEQIRNFEGLKEMLFTQLEKEGIKKFANVTVITKIKELNKSVINISETREGVETAIQYLEEIKKIVEAIHSNDSQAVERAIQEAAQWINKQGNSSINTEEPFNRQQIISLVAANFNNPIMKNLMSDVLKWVDSNQSVIDKKK